MVMEDRTTRRNRFAYSRRTRAITRMGRVACDSPVLNARDLMSQAIRNVLGMLLIATGLVLVPVPIVPGLPLIAAGAVLLGRQHPLIVASMAWLQKRGLLRKENSPK